MARAGILFLHVARCAEGYIINAARIARRFSRRQVEICAHCRRVSPATACNPFAPFTFQIFWMRPAKMRGSPFPASLAGRARSIPFSPELSSQQNRLAARDHQSVFVVGGQAAVPGFHGPAVAVSPDVAIACRDDRLDGQDESFGKNVACLRIGPVWHGWAFVNRAAHAVSAKFPDDAEAAAPHFPFHGAADFLCAIARASRRQCLAKRALRAAREFARPALALRWRNFHRKGGISVIAILLRREIEL